MKNLNINVKINFDDVLWGIVIPVVLVSLITGLIIWSIAKLSKVEKTNFLLAVVSAFAGVVSSVGGTFLLAYAAGPRAVMSNIGSMIYIGFGLGVIASAFVLSKLYSINLQKASYIAFTSFGVVFILGMLIL